MNKKEIRLNSLFSLIQKGHNKSIKELAIYFNVSEMTIRRDLDTFKENNLITIDNGTPYLNNDKISNGDLKYQLLHQKDIRDNEKERIGFASASMIDPNDIIIIDVGTTAEKLIKFIPVNYPITVICFSMNVLIEIQKLNIHKLIFAGGYYHPDTQMFESNDGVNFLKSLRANKYFMSAAGVSAELGLTCVNEYEVNTKRQSVQSSDRKVLMVDSSKFDNIKPAFIVSLNYVNTIVTDSGITEEWKEIIKENNIELIIV